MALSAQFTQHFSVLLDPRKDTHNKRHKLMDILILTILAVICGADDWVNVEYFGKSKEEWLKTFLELPHGIPSHDTIGNLFSRLNPQQLQESFLNWIHSLVEITGGEIISIDGKTLRRSHDKKNGKKAIHMVSAWANKNRLVLGQRKVDDKSNEITAIPQLLKMLDIKGCTVTLDAMGCQRKIAEQIYSQGGDYVLAVKENQEKLETAIADLFETAKAREFDAMVYSKDETLEKGHGRIEERHYVALPMMYLHKFKLRWKGFKSVAMVESTREVIGEKPTIERRYYISSLQADAKRLGEAIRQHWGIENSLHWSLDISFREDECRVRTGNAAENFSVLRHIALNLLRQETSKKIGIKTKRNISGWDHAYLAKVLAGSSTQAKENQGL